MTSGSARREPLLLGFGAALALSAVWVGLTAWTAQTYHLAPVLVAAAPGFVAWSGGGAPLRYGPPGSFALGAAAAALGWIAIVVVGIEPTAALVDDQLGGVVGEVVVGGLLGGLIGAGLVLRRRAHA